MISISSLHGVLEPAANLRRPPIKPFNPADPFL
jgi:hypothetical protein